MGTFLKVWAILLLPFHSPLHPRLRGTAWREVRCSALAAPRVCSIPRLGRSEPSPGPCLALLGGGSSADALSSRACLSLRWEEPGPPARARATRERAHRHPTGCWPERARGFLGDPWVPEILLRRVRNDDSESAGGSEKSRPSGRGPRHTLHADPGPYLRREVAAAAAAETVGTPRGAQPPADRGRGPRRSDCSAAPCARP